MKFTLSWLKDHLETDASLEKICETLTSIGLEVEQVEDRSKTLSAFKVAHIIEAEKHPNADKLKLCTVDTGSEKLKIVCGAANARAGIKVVLAPIGTIIPSNGMVIKKSKIRDVESNGMLCSSAELSLGEDGDGIIELSEKAEVGISFAKEYGLDDPVIEIAITPNRGDCLGVHGIARDLSAAGLGKLKKPGIKNIAGNFESPINVKIEDAKTMPFYVGRYFRNIKNSESPEWLKRRLKAIGIKPISALIDITNYITFDFGRPLHVYDAKKINGNLSLRMARKSEKITALNDKQYNLDESIPVISDSKEVVAIGGIIGEKNSGVGNETTDVFLEVALFNPTTVAKAGRRLMLDSDARYRFERGVDAAFLENACELASQMIIELCGGECSKPVIAGSKPLAGNVIKLNPNKIKSFGGIDIEANRISSILESLEFSIKRSGDFLEVNSPTWRNDVSIEADLIEEVLRINGYDNIPSIPLDNGNSSLKPALNDKQKFISNIRRVLSAEKGFTETITFSFMGSKDSEYFSTSFAKNKLLNPISNDLDVMRPSIIPNIINALKNNFNRGYKNLSLFEIGPVFSEKYENLQTTSVCGIRFGETSVKSIYKDGRKFDIFDVKDDVLTCLSSAVNIDKIIISQEVPSYYHPGRSGNISLGKNIISYFGEIHPLILRKMDVEFPVMAFEVFIDNLPIPKKKITTKPKLEISNFQSVERDFAFIIDENVSAEEITKSINKVDKIIIEKVNIFDVYTGKSVDDGKKSIAFSIRLQPTEKTLSDTEINDLSTKVIKSIEAIGGILRA